jgi:HD superfamily phosphodiesterase
MNVDTYLVERATEHATTFLAPLCNRWLHVQGVVQRAYSVSTIFEEDQRYLIAAACLHDIGYTHSLKKTGFHPLDGASLVAHHSEAAFEAQLRGYTHYLHAFPEEDFTQASGTATLPSCCVSSILPLGSP